MFVQSVVNNEQSDKSTFNNALFIATKKNDKTLKILIN